VTCNEQFDPMTFTRFPNAFRCLGCPEEPVLASKIEDTGANHSIFVEPLHANGTKFKNTLPISTNLLSDYPPKTFNCKFYSKEKIISTRKYCDVGEYVVDFLKESIRFIRDNTVEYWPKDFREDQKNRGYVALYSTHETCTGGCKFMISKEILTAVYCNFDTARNLKVNFAAWWEPFDPEVWTCIGSILLMLGVFMCLLRNLAFFEFITKSKASISSKFASNSLNIYRSILRQDDLQNNSLLLMICMTMILVTSLYENIITSQLIVPEVPKIFQTIADLAENGYQFRSTIAFSVFRSAIESYLSSIGKVELLSKTAYEVDDFNMWEVRDISLRRAYIGHGTDMHWKYQASYLNWFSTYKCHTVQRPVSETLSFISFYNMFTHQQMHYLLIMQQSGFLSLFEKRERYSHDMFWEIAGRRKGTPEHSNSSSYVSNLNLVPIYTILASLLTISWLVFLIEIRLDLQIKRKIREVYKLFKITCSKKTRVSKFKTKSKILKTFHREFQFLP
jgi:hypothetical protein